MKYSNYIVCNCKLMFCSAASVRTVRKDICKAQTDKALVFKNKCVLVGSSSNSCLSFTRSAQLKDNEDIDVLGIVVTVREARS